MSSEQDLSVSHLSQNQAVSGRNAGLQLLMLPPICDNKSGNGCRQLHRQEAISRALGEPELLQPSWSYHDHCYSVHPDPLEDCSRKMGSKAYINKSDHCSTKAFFLDQWS